MKKIIISLLIAVFSITTLSATVYAGGKGNKRKGKYNYRKIYKACNAADPSVPLKPAISPDSKTMAQWDRLFAKKDFSDFGCKAQWDALSEKDLLHILTYMKSGAADSPTPAKCK